MRQSIKKFMRTRKGLYENIRHYFCFDPSVMKSLDSKFYHRRPLVAIIRCWLSLVLIAGMMFACQAPSTRNQTLSIEQMTINARTNPLGIAVDNISFAWAI